MKKLIAVLALTSAAIAAPAFSAVGVSIQIGEPGFYGQLDVGDYYRPRVIYSEPVVVYRRYGALSPVYLRVPAEHSRNWKRYCNRYDACGRPVYFVRDDWYRDASPRQEISAFEIVAILEEELGDDKIRSVIDLCLEPLPVQILAFATGDVPLRKSGDANGERAELADAPNQFV